MTDKIKEYRILHPQQKDLFHFVEDVKIDEIETIYTHENKALDEQIGGNHYKSLKIQPIEYIMANNLGYCEANILKYITRYKDKNGLQDLMKAKHYIEILIGSFEKSKD